MAFKFSLLQLLRRWHVPRAACPDRHVERAERIARENERLRRRLAELRALTVSAERDDHDRVG